jgi:hypothetical protein
VRPAPPVSDRVLWWAAFLGLSLLGGAFALGIPLGGQPDEPAHLIKASALYRGELTWDARSPLIVGTGPDDPTRTEITVDAPVGYAELYRSAACLAGLPRQDATCSPPVRNDTSLTETDRDTYVVAYPPVPYLLMGWPTAVLEPSKAIFVVRLVNVAMCAALVASALVAGASTAGGWTALGVALAVTPTAVLFFSSPNPNGLEIAAAIGVAAALLALLGAGGRPTGRAVARLAVAASVLALARPASLAVLGLVVAVVVAGAASRRRVRELLDVPTVRAALVPVALAVALALAWLLYARPLEVLVGVPRPGLETGDAVRESLSLFPKRLREMVGVFGWGEVPAPPWMWWSWLVVTVALLVTALVVGRWRHRLVLVGSVLATVAVALALEAPRAAELGFIWQGRYWLPFAVAVPVYAAWVVGRSGRVPRVGTPVAAVAVAACTTAGLVGAHGITVTRFATGSIEPWWGYLDDAPWEPKVAPVALLAMVLTGAALWAAVIVATVLPAARSAAPAEPAPEPLQEALPAS